MTDLLTVPPLDLPPLLLRPEARDPIARLSVPKAEPREDGSKGVTRFRLAGSPAVVALARKIMPAVLSPKIDAASWPAIQPAFEDLLMMLHRYPVEISQSARALFEEQYSEVIRQWELKNLRHLPTIKKGARFFRGELAPFQVTGKDFMVRNRKTICGDDMGLGKTVEYLAAIDELDEWPAAVVVQPHVQKHWREKIPQFMHAAESGITTLEGKHLTWVHLRGTKPDVRIPKADIYIVHYLVLWAWRAFLLGRGVKTIGFDEVQELRHPGTRKYDAAEALTRHAKNVLGLSGTPFYNRGPEMFDVVNAVNHGALGTKESFYINWCTRDESDGKWIIEDTKAFGQYLRDRGLLIRRLKDDKDVALNLPPKRRVVEPVDADNDVFSDLIRRAVELAKEAEEHSDPFDRAQLEARAIAFTRLATGAAKAPAVCAFLRGLQEAGEPTLVFAHHHLVIDEILRELHPFKPVCVTGRQSQAQKGESQDAFVNGETNLAIIGLRAATGLDGFQQRARVVVFAELDWSPMVHRQGEDRAHRWGQSNSVLCYYIVTDVGTDPAMRNVLRVKEMQFSGVMQDPEPTAAELAAAEREAKRHMGDILKMLRRR